MLISYLSAPRHRTLVFQLILVGNALGITGTVLILLVAIGGCMLLISRIRDESPHGIRIGVIQTVGSTGGVITSAGLIFAASMFGLVARHQHDGSGGFTSGMDRAGHRWSHGHGTGLDLIGEQTGGRRAGTRPIHAADQNRSRWLRRVKGHRRKADRRPNRPGSATPTGTQARRQPSRFQQRPLTSRRRGST